MEDEYNDLTKEEYDKLYTKCKTVFTNVKIYQKFTCSHCKTRLTVDTPDVWFESAFCEVCGGLTVIEKAGMFTVISPPVEN